MKELAKNSAKMRRTRQKPSILRSSQKFLKEKLAVAEPESEKSQLNIKYMGVFNNEFGILTMRLPMLQERKGSLQEASQASMKAKKEETQIESESPKELTGLVPVPRNNSEEDKMKKQVGFGKSRVQMFPEKKIFSSTSYQSSSKTKETKGKEYFQSKSSKEKTSEPRSSFRLKSHLDRPERQTKSHENSQISRRKESQRKFYPQFRYYGAQPLLHFAKFPPFKTKTITVDKKNLQDFSTFVSSQNAVIPHQSFHSKRLPVSHLASAKTINASFT